MVSVIFCDICDFDKIVETYEDQEIISLLDGLFSRLDSKCDDIGVTKIETVGKTYLACAGLKDFDSDLVSDINEISHARRAIEFAFEVLSECQKTFMKNGETLKMKIGIHSGPVIAGVVGYHKLQFSLVGDTVNTASRMATTLNSGNMIQISMKTYNLIDDIAGLHFKNNYPEVKGKGAMHTLIVEHFSIKDSGITDYDDSIENSSSNQRDSILSEKFSKYANISKYSSTVFIRSFDFVLPLNEKFKQAFFVETKEEKIIQENLLIKYLKTNTYGLIIFLILNIFLIILYSVSYSINPRIRDSVRLVVLIVQEISALIILILSKKLFKYQITIYIIFTLYYSGTLAFLISNKFDSVSYPVDLMFFYFHFILSNFCTGLHFNRNILFNLIQIITIIIKFSLFPPLIDHIFITFFFIFCVVSSSHLRDKLMRKDYLVKELFTKEHSKTEQLLTQMMPFNALKNLQAELTVIDRLSQVTFMYADIVGFTSWSSTRTANEVIDMLSQLFTKFDKLCVQNEIYKVYTIGDCYVAMGFTGDYKRNSAKECAQVVKFGFELVKIIEEVNLNISAELNMRIGIHTGDAIGGITGTNIVRYDVYGKDVMIANKMESNGIPGKVTISEKTKEMLEEIMPGKFEFEFLKGVKAWGDCVKAFVLREI